MYSSWKSDPGSLLCCKLDAKPIFFHLQKFKGRERTHRQNLLPAPHSSLLAFVAYFSARKGRGKWLSQCILWTVHTSTQIFIGRHEKHPHSLFLPASTDHWGGCQSGFRINCVCTSNLLPRQVASPFHFFLPQTRHGRLMFRVLGHRGGPAVLKPLIGIVAGYSVLQMSDKDFACWQNDTLPPICLWCLISTGTLRPRGGRRRDGRVEISYFMWA